MLKFDVWVYLPTEEEGKTDEHFVDTFEGYISEITNAVLVLYPTAVGIYCMPENTG